MNYNHTEISLGFQVTAPTGQWGESFASLTAKKRYGRVWRNGKLFHRNYGRELKNGRGMSMYEVTLERLNRVFS